MNRFGFLPLLLITFCLSACSKDGTKEFFFGSGEGPDPFVIGSTLSPLRTDFHAQNGVLPKPQPVRPPSQMPSRAKKASEIMGLTDNNTSVKSQITSMPMSLASTEVTGSIKKSEKQIDFYEFDQQMQKTYKEQEASGYLLSGVLGKDDTADPTISSEILDKE